MKEYEVVVLSKFPNVNQRSDGMMIRVIEIDEILRETNKLTYLNIYISLSLKPTRQIIDGRDIYNMHLLLHQRWIYKILKNCQVVYCHSIINFTKGLFTLSLSKPKIILDAHGVVPEEALYSGNRLEYLIFSIVERIAFKRVDGIICVTKSMIQHFSEKYRISSEKFFYIPIQSDNKLSKPTLASKNFDGQVIIATYAGGDQKWQNIELMFNAIKSRFEVHYNLFFPQIVASKYLHFTASNVIISSVNKSQLHHHYEHAHLGFLLRDASIVNRVASPTKLNEYIQFGIVPILLQSRVGDIQHFGYKYLLYEDFIKEDLPTVAALHVVAEHNLEMYAQQSLDAKTGIRKLKDYLNHYIKGQNESA